MDPLAPDDIRRRAFTRKSIRAGTSLWMLVPVGVAVVVGGLILFGPHIGPIGLVIMLVVTSLALLSTIALAVVQRASSAASRRPTLRRKVASRLARGHRAPRGSLVPIVLVGGGVVAGTAATLSAVWLVPGAARSPLWLFPAAVGIMAVPVGIIVAMNVGAARALAPLGRADVRGAREHVVRHRWWMPGPWAVLHEGTLDTVQGDFERAETVLRGWLGRWRRSLLLPFVLENLAWALIGSHKWVDAEEVIATLVDLDPTRGATFAQLAVVDLERGTVDDATIDWLELALELNLRGPLRERPRLDEIKAALAWARAAGGRPAEARSLIAEVDVESGSQLVIAMRCFRLGRAWLGLGDPERADALFERAIELSGEAWIGRRAAELRGSAAATPPSPSTSR